MSTTERCAIVTGGAQNIGGAIAARLHRDGYRVIVLDIVEPEAEALRADARLVDLSDRAAAEKSFSEIAAEHPVYALVNNVGVVAPAPLDEVDVNDFDRLMHLNTRTALIAAKAVVPAMRKLGGGRIVMNTSRVTLGKHHRTLYSATKGALQAMARTWALELAAEFDHGQLRGAGADRHHRLLAEQRARLACDPAPDRVDPREADGDSRRRRSRRELLLQRRGEFCDRSDAIRMRRGDGGVGPAKRPLRS